MEDEDQVEMSADERDNFLGSGGTGVISLSQEDSEFPYAVPVSYGYNAAESMFYFRLATGDGGQRRTLPDRAVSFVTYGETDDG
nr:pyridoxamine 5'-phosphate oxidase family protein [Halostella sp. PRR32]